MRSLQKSGRYVFPRSLVDIPHIQSQAARILLEKALRKAQGPVLPKWIVWLKFREEFLAELPTDACTCFYCDKPLDRKITNQKHPMCPTLDHFTPLASGGSKYDKKNLVISCRKCNSKKGHMQPEEFIRNHAPQKYQEIYG